MSYGHKKKHKEKKHEVIYGPHAILECIRAKRRTILAVYTTKVPSMGWKRVRPYLPKNVPVHFVDKTILAGRAETPDHNGIVALVTPFKFISQIFSPKKHKRILLLDAVQDVRNLGGILRSAYVIGIDGVVLCKHKGAPLNSAVFKTSAGLAEYLEIYQAPSLPAAVHDLKKAGYNLYMAVLDNGVDALSVSYKEPMCLVIGNEAVGISRDIQKEGTCITLPQRRSDISFNASVAAGILLFTLTHSAKK